MFTIISLVATLQLWADVVPVSEAQTIASQFLQKNSARRARVVGKTLSPSAELKLSAVGDASSYYIFNVGTDEGFVVVSGDDATEEILGYSYSGSIHPDSMPCNMRMLFDSYTDQIIFIREHGITKEQNLGARKAARKAEANYEFRISEEKRTKFHQKHPYNYYCPSYYDENKGENINCVTGCVAAAMAGLMYAYKWPSHITNEIPEYTTDKLKFDISEIANNTAINWSQILQEYETNWLGIQKWDNEQRDAVARLMKMAGSSVLMDYNKESVALNQSIPYALSKYFGYELAVCEKSDNYIWSEWVEKLKSELAKDVPVLYGGSRKDSKGNWHGHSFLLEGYDEEDYFYVNFGGGDGGIAKYRLNIISGENAFNYPLDQDALFNVAPRVNLSPIDVPLRLWTKSVCPVKGVYKRSEYDEFRNIALDFDLINCVPVTSPLIRKKYDMNGNVFDIGVCFKNSSKKDCEPSVPIIENAELPFSSGCTSGVNDIFSYGKDLKYGHYYIYLTSRETGTDEWILNDNSQNVFGEAWICDDMMSIKASDSEAIRLSASRMHANEQFKMGVPAFLYYSVTNKGDDYKGALLVMLMIKDEERGLYGSKVIKIVNANLSSGESLTIPVTWTPDVTGEVDVILLNRRWEKFYSKTYHVADSDEPTNNLAATTVTIENGSIEEQSFTGSILRGTMTITNQDNCAFADTVSLVLSTGLNEQRQQGYRLSIAAGASVDVQFEYRGLKVGREYTLRALMGEDMLQFYESPALESHFAVPDIPDDESADVANHDLTHYEYWFDDDYSGRQQVSIGGKVQDVTTAIPAKNLSNGMHWINLRVRQDNGSYSPVSSSPFMKSGVSNSAEKSLEFWFDEDFSNRQSMSFSGDIPQVEDLVSAKHLEDGLHNLNLWVKYADGNNTVYSSVSSTPFYRYRDLIATKIVYWFEEDFSKRITTALPSKGASGLTSLDIEMSDMKTFPLGVHRIYLCFASSSGEIISPTFKFLVLKMVSGTVGKIEYWLDDNYAGRKTIEGVFESIDGEHVFVNPFDLSDASYGLHTVNYRAVVDDGSIYTPVSTAYMIKTINGNQAEKSIEYWFDDAFSAKQSLSLNGDTLQAEGSVSASHLEEGLHNYNMWVKYSDSKNTAYSPVSSMPFYRNKNRVPTQIVYWFEENFDKRMTTPIPQKDAEGLTSFDIDLSNITTFPLGLNRMYLCFANAEGEIVSPTFKFLLLKMVSGSVNQIEYWVDDDFKDGRKTVDGTFEAKDGEYVFVDPFDLSGVPFGSHTVNYRAVVDGGTIYSPVSSAHVMKIGRGKADKIEYWVDGDTTTVKTVTGMLDTADGAYVFVDPFDLSGVTNGLHRVFYRVAAENGEPGSAIGMMPVIVKSMYGPGPALMTQYRIVADDDTELASGTLNLKQEAELNLTLDASSLGEGEHKLQATFWNSFGGSTATDWTPFWVRGPLAGDVNRDGQVGIGDIVAVTNFMAGSAGDVTLMQADVNGDGDVGIGDIVAITNIMAGAQ